MAKDKQIEEMAKICCDICEYEHCGECLNDNGCDIGGCFMAKHTADNLYNAGYRKASDIVKEFIADFEKSCFGHFGEFDASKYVNFKKKYESEGENNDTVSKSKD